MSSLNTDNQTPESVGVVELILVRHGRPNRVEGVFPPDPGLTALGFAQADAVAKVLGSLPVSAIFSSGLKRALQTAEPTAQRVGLDIDIDHDLAELDLGGDYYIPIEEISESDPRLVEWRAVMADPGTQTVITEFRQRVVQGVDRVRRRVGSGVAAVFCHGGVIGVCVDKATAGHPSRRRDPEYGSITRIHIAPDGAWTLRTYNEIQHVEAVSLV